jgi:DNA-binding CsgD family transcriptional regulator
VAHPDPSVSRSDPDPQPWLSTLADGAEQPLSRVADLSETARAALILGHVRESLDALTQQRAAAGHDQAALVWALTTSSACRAMFGQLRRARADLAEARRTCHQAAPVLAEPFWRFAEVICNWLAGNWAAAQEDAAALTAGQVSPISPALAGAATALRAELLRGLGLPRQSRLLARRLEGVPPVEMSAWALAGLDVDQGRSASALRRLAAARDADGPGLNRAALPLVLHRLAETAFACGNRDVTAQAAADLAGLDQAAPVTQILAGLAQAYASGDPQPARRAQQRAEAEGAVALAAEALTVRGRIGDEPMATLLAAHATWRRIGAPGKAGAVAAVMHAAGLPPPVVEDGQRDPRTPAEGPVPLTARERSLARLVHEGRTNQQIARELHISVKTVEAYLTRIYRKTSCSSRVELAVAVTQRRVHVGH